MTDHSIVPPKELINDWLLDSINKPSLVEYIATEAAKWAADMELEACSEWVAWNIDMESSTSLCSERRPKSPSLKEQAMQAWCRFQGSAHTTADEMMSDFTTIRKALEALPND